MKHLSKILLIAVSALSLAAHNANAQESALPPDIADSKEAKDAVGGMVKEEATWQTIYDVYTRQLAYREKTKEFDESLARRQESFAEPSAKLVESYKENLETIYENEAKIEAEKQKKKEREAKLESEVGEDKPPESQTEQKDEIAKADVPPPPVLKEMEIPAHEGEDEGVKRKVVTQEGAPEFDPSKL